MNKLQIIPRIIPSVLLALLVGCASPSIDPLPLPDTTPPPRFPEPDPPMIERPTPPLPPGARPSRARRSLAVTPGPRPIELGEFAIPADGLYAVESTSDFREWVEVHRFWVPQPRHLTEREAVLSYDFSVQWQAPITARAFFRVRQIQPQPHPAP